MFGKNLVVQLWCKTLPTNQNAVFFDHQYLWKYSIDTLDFLHGDNHKQKEGFEITTFGRMWPVVPLIQSDCRILSSSIFLEGISQ